MTYLFFIVPIYIVLAAEEVNPQYWRNNLEEMLSVSNARS